MTCSAERASFNLRSHSRRRQVIERCVERNQNIVRDVEYAIDVVFV